MSIDAYFDEKKVTERWVRKVQISFMKISFLFTANKELRIEILANNDA